MQTILTDFLARQAESIANRVKRNHAHIAAKPSDTDSWWSGRLWDKELTALLSPLYDEMATRFSRQAAKPLRTSKAGFIDKVLDLVRRSAGLRITGINQTTRDTVARLVAQGVEEGLSPADLADRIRDSGAFSESRSETIARTETGTVYNQAHIETYREFEVAQVEVIDGDQDDVCAEANGSVWLLDDALSNPLGHPNCTRDFIPVVAAKAVQSVSIPQIDLHLHQDATVVNVEKQDPPIVNVTMPNTLPPIVNVPPAEITVNPTPVSVEAPAVTVNVPEQKALQQVQVVSMPDRVHRLTKSKKGDITGSVETDGS
jgi:SPP1 gp7 family putative phage head morphogenesis protein